jgi:ABC-type histidine transport system ATPase subunit
MVFQSFNLWSHMTILENIIEAPVHVLGKNKKDAKDEALVLMEQVGIQDKANSYPIHLSGGQQQRVAIARALAISPEILLFDEPTSSLDPELVDEVLGVMRKLADDGKTMLVVTHEMEFAKKVSNKVIFLHDGLVEEAGHPDTVFTNPSSERCRNFLFNRRS